MAPDASKAEPTLAADADTAGLADARSVDGFLQRVQRRFADPVRCSDTEGNALLPHRLALRAPVADASDVVDLVPWMRHSDSCIRQVAIWAALSMIPFDLHLVSSASLHDPEHKDYHALFLALKRYLRDNKVNYNPAIFDGMYLTVYKYEFPSIVHGRWTEDSGLDRLAFVNDLEVDRDHFKFTRRNASPDPRWQPSAPRVTEIKDVVVNELGQFVVTAVHPKGEVVWVAEVPGGSYRSQVVESSWTSWYQIWPTSDGVLWLRVVGSHGWTKFRRTR